MEVRKNWLKVAALCLVAGIGLLAGPRPTPAHETEHRRSRLRLFDRLEEARIRAELGIPSRAEKVLILSQTAHMDWDWQNWFVTNVDNMNPPDQAQPSYWMTCREWADEILANSSQFLSSAVDYYYSNAEIGFVRAFAEGNAGLFADMTSAATGDGSPRYRIVGGGITSPDNLLPAGESFIRDYLVGKTWMEKNGLDWTGQIWVPDDFGHDSQLPIVLEAMGAHAVGFARVPCDDDDNVPGCLQGGNENPPGRSAAGEILMDPDTGGLDFWWQAADSSLVQAHWLIGHYSQGGGIAASNCGTLGSTCIQQYIDTNEPVSPTPYIYVPVSNDFMMPVGSSSCPGEVSPTLLLSYADNWNETMWETGESDVYAVVATFDHYARLVKAHVRNDPSLLHTRTFHTSESDAATEEFRPTPYWMGFYATRPELKRLHYTAARNLVGAEIFDAVHGVLLQKAGKVPFDDGAIFEEWNELVPSNHHDFITGTAVDFVYDGTYTDPDTGETTTGEQLVRLEKSLAASDALFELKIGALAGNLPASANSIVVFNQLSYERSGLVDYPKGDGRPCHHDTGVDRCLYYVNGVPGLGYRSYDLTKLDLPGDVQIAKDGEGNVVIANSWLSATISAADGSLMAISDKGGHSPTQLLDGPGNMLKFFSDSGGLYQFGYTIGRTFTLLSPTVEVIHGPEVLERGPIRVRVSVLLKVLCEETCALTSSQTFEKRYELEYELVVGEPFLRMSVTGAAPGDTGESWGTTIMVEFPLTSMIERLEHGTPYHWDYKEPWAWGSGEFTGVFQATHDFVLAKSDDSESNTGYLGAIYHASVPAWAAEDSSLYGVVLRNSPNAGFGAAGHDAAKHRIEYAFGVPSAVRSPSTGVPLKTARSFNTPLRGRVIDEDQQGAFPEKFSLASLNETKAFIAAVKRGTYNSSDLVFRLYQPTNAPLDSLSLEVTGVTGLARLEKVTALEVPLGPGKYGRWRPLGKRQYQVPMDRALATVALSGVFSSRRLDVDRIVASAKSGGSAVLSCWGMMPRDALDPDAGLELTIADDRGTARTATFDSTQCRARRAGRTRCTSERGATMIFQRSLWKPDMLRFKCRMHDKGASFLRARGPLTVTMDQSGTVLKGSSKSCKKRVIGLVCED